MKTSESINTISGALVSFQAKLQPITRSKVVKTGKYEFRYAPLDAIMDHVRALLWDNGLAITQAIDNDSITTRLVHTSGEWMESCTYLNREQASMQQFGGEVTYKRRYALCALLGIVPDDDQDAPRHKPVDGVLQGLTPRRQSYVTELSEIIKEKIADGDEYGAYEDYATVDDNEEKVALWSLLPSEVRSTIKKQGQALKGK